MFGLLPKHLDLGLAYFANNSDKTNEFDSGGYGVIIDGSNRGK
jgi:hypothetical protein